MVSLSGSDLLGFDGSVGQNLLNTAVYENEFNADNDLPREPISNYSTKEVVAPFSPSYLISPSTSSDPFSRQGEEVTAVPLAMWVASILYGLVATGTAGYGSYLIAPEEQKQIWRDAFTALNLNPFQLLKLKNKLQSADTETLKQDAEVQTLAEQFQREIKKREKQKGLPPAKAQRE